MKKFVENFIDATDDLFDYIANFSTVLLLVIGIIGWSINHFISLAIYLKLSLAAVILILAILLRRNLLKLLHEISEKFRQHTFEKNLSAESIKAAKRIEKIDFNKLIPSQKSFDYLIEKLENRAKKQLFHDVVPSWEEFVLRYNEKNHPAYSHIFRAIFYSKMKNMSIEFYCTDMKEPSKDQKRWLRYGGYERSCSLPHVPNWRNSLITILDHSELHIVGKTEFSLISNNMPNGMLAWNCVYPQDTLGRSFSYFLRGNTLTAQVDNGTETVVTSFS